MERDLAVRLDGVGRRYGMRGAWVLRGVDLGIPAGALVRVEGGNGTGKSTLLRLLAGIDAPCEGRVSGRPRTAFVPERFPAAMPFTALGYLTHMGRVHGLAHGAARRSAAQWLERFGAGGYARTPLSELSKGSSQKVAVAQALLAEPELLILDEAWTGLDSAARAELDRAVGERTAAGGSVVFVDHDPRRLQGVAEETYVLAGAALNRRTVQATSQCWQGPTVLIETQGPPGAGLPAAVTAAAVTVSAMTGSAVAAGPDASAGPTRLTVPAPHSDRVLRELLTARPPWHVAKVMRVTEAVEAGAVEAMETADGEVL
ncbi:ATP-binding cassette domain-containing protein [Streptomyces sp. NPDC058284]|uniref:ABC transporter ATP-binding protein n=1 Tax=unclassified Streptomyces TaxID=2593676 RepID=UPI00364DEAFD